MISTFRMSDGVKQRLIGYLSKIPPGDREGFTAAIVDLLAEATVAMRREVLEELRKQWSDALEVMFMREPRERKVPTKFDSVGRATTPVIKLEGGGGSGGGPKQE